MLATAGNEKVFFFLEKSHLSSAKKLSGMLLFLCLVDTEVRILLPDPPEGPETCAGS